MLFVTNRTPKQSLRSRTNRKISFDLQNTSVSQNMFFCQRLSNQHYIEIGSQAFFQALIDLPEKTQILFYIHGFNNTGEAEIFPHASLLQQLINQHADSDLVHVVPIIWPCDDDSVVAIADDYWDDQQAADASAFAFARFLAKFDGWRRLQQKNAMLCTRRINILAHSMGNRVLRNAFQQWAKSHTYGVMPQLFRNIFMVAADVVNGTLAQGEQGELITHAARNVVVYYANDDLALAASKVANLKNKITACRLGMTGVKELTVVAKNVYEVDCDRFNNQCEKPLGHVYFLMDSHNSASPVIAHLADAIKYGRVMPNVKQHIL